MAKQNTDTSLALYEDFDLEALAEDKEEAKQASSSKRIKIPEGKTVLRFLPARKGSSHAPKPWRAIWMHYVDIPGLENSVIFVCPRMEAKLPCRVCTRAKQMQASQNIVDQKKGERLLPKRRLSANVVNRAAMEDGVKILEFGKTVLDQLQEIRDPNAGLGLNFTHPVTGHDIIVIRKGTGKNDTEYKLNVDPKSMPNGTPLHEDAKVMKELLEQMHSLDALAEVPSDEEITDLLAGKKPDRSARDERRTAATQGATAAEQVYGEGHVVDDDDF